MLSLGTTVFQEIVKRMMKEVTALAPFRVCVFFPLPPSDCDALLTFHRVHMSKKTMHPDHTLNFDQVSVSCNNPSAHSRVRCRFGYLAEQASPAGDEHHEQLGSMTSLNFASTQGDSGMSSTSSSSTCSVAEVAASSIPGTDSTSRAPIGCDNKNAEGWSSREQQVVRHIRRHFKHNGHKAISSDASSSTCWSTTLLPKRKSSIESKWRSARYMMRRQLMLKDNSTLRKLGKKSDDIKTLSCRLRVWNHLPKSSVYEAIESESHRLLPNQESFLAREARMREYQRYQEVIDMQKQLDAVSKQIRETFQTHGVSPGRNFNVAQRD